MSIATLKRKVASQYNNSSVGFAQFSINGTRRSQGWVGQTSLSRSLPRTLMKGNVIKGHGGCCGTYPVYHVIQSGVTSTEDPRVVKSSVMNTMGMIDTKYRWITRPAPYSVVKPDTTNNLNDQQSYIDSVRKQAIYDASVACPASPGFVVNTGLYFGIYTGYFGDSITSNTNVPYNPNDDVNYFDTRTPTSTGQSSTFTSLQTSTAGILLDASNNLTTSVQFLGYFLVPKNGTGTWSFTLTSDDASFMWIGDNAISGYTMSNSLVNNKGLHGNVTVTGSTLLFSNTYYPVRVQFGNNQGSASFRLSVTDPAGNEVTDTSKYFFNQLDAALVSGKYLYAGRDCEFSTKNYKTRVCNLTDDPTKTLYLSQSDNLNNIHNKCISNDTFNLRKNTKGIAFACGGKV